MHEPWQERMGDFAGDYYKEALPVEMADKTVWAMKVQSETGGVRGDARRAAHAGGCGRTEG